MTITTPEITGGWFRAMRTTLGLSIETMSYLLDVREDTIRKAWESGAVRIPHGVRDELSGLIGYTDTATEYLAHRASTLVDPCIIVYRKYWEVPNGHIALVLGLEWWARTAYNAASSADPEQAMFIGTMDEVADRLDEPTNVTVDDLHDRRDVMGLYCFPGDSRLALPGLTHDRSVLTR